MNSIINQHVDSASDTKETPAMALSVGSAAGSAQAGGLRELHPAYFAMVMATGIVSIASQLVGYRPIAVALLVLNVAFYLALWGLMVLRAVRYPRAFWGDFLHHGRAVGYFTWVAATCVLATQFVAVHRWLAAATVLGIFGMVLWAIMTYTILTALTVVRKKPELAVGLNGGWLVAVVAAQSVSVISSHLGHVYPNGQLLLFVSLVMWLGGGMLYIWLTSLIFYRYTFFVMDPADMTPPYWINMGAVAISTLAGTQLVLATPQIPLIAQMLPFIKGMTLLFWATATWWIPMLVILGIWRHGYRRYPLRYDPLFWGAVFPLGMYTACTWQLAWAIDMLVLQQVSRVFIFVALGAWALTLFGLVHSLLKRLADRGS